MRPCTCILPKEGSSKMGTDYDGTGSLCSICNYPNPLILLYSAFNALDYTVPIFEWYVTINACMLHLGRRGLYMTLSKVVLFIQMLPQFLRDNINQDWLFSTGWVYSKCLYPASPPMYKRQVDPIFFPKHPNILPPVFCQCFISVSPMFHLYFTCVLPVFNPISAGVSDQRLVPGGWGSLGPRSYFRLIWTSFWTCGTIVEQFIVKGVRQ